MNNRLLVMAVVGFVLLLVFSDVQPGDLVDHLRALTRGVAPHPGR